VPPRQATGLTGPIIVAMLGALLVLMAARRNPVLWPLFALGLAFLAVGAVLYLRQGRARYAPRYAAPSPGAPTFALTTRGYDPAAVDELVTRARDALTRPAARRREVREHLLAARPRLVMRGYAVAEVDAYLREMADRLESPAS
jgi:hypothetical protein